jgi:hypothetical protein
VVIDVRVHFRPGARQDAAKVFKLKTSELPAGGVVSCRQALLLADLATRRHYPGRTAWTSS